MAKGRGGTSPPEKKSGIELLKFLKNVYSQGGGKKSTSNDKFKSLSAVGVVRQAKETGGKETGMKRECHAEIVFLGADRLSLGRICHKIKIYPF